MQNVPAEHTTLHTCQLNRSYLCINKRDHIVDLTYFSTGCILVSKPLHMILNLYLPLHQK